MTRKYSLVIEGNEEGYSAYVPELPSILVTGGSMDEIDPSLRKRSALIGRRRRQTAHPRLCSGN